MEKTIKLTTSEVIKWLTFLAIVISTFVVNQVDIRNLKAENKQREEEQKIMMQKLQEQERIVAGINEKLTIIYDDVKGIYRHLLGTDSNHNQ